MDLQITNEFPLSKCDEIVDFLAQPRLLIKNTDYPDFLDWLQKVHNQLTSQEKRALIVVEKTRVVGAAIYQRHKTIVDALEIKNLTVRPDWSGRKLASVLMRNAEIEGGRDFHAGHVICDAKENNHAVRMFLFSAGYQLLKTDDLYQKKSGNDLVYTKLLYPYRLQFPSARISP